jgi:hypothetical protein
VIATQSAERAGTDAPRWWTEDEVGELSEADARLLMKMATLGSTPHDLFIIRWCVAHLRKLQNSVDYCDGTGAPKRPAV